MNLLARAFPVSTVALIVAFLAGPLSFAAPRHLTPSTANGVPASPDWKEPIQKVLDAQVSAWNRGDIEGFMAGYWNSPDFIYIGNKQVVRGWQAMLDRYHEVFAAKEGGSAPMGTLQITETQFMQLDRESALVWGTYVVVHPDGKRHGGLYTLVMRKFPAGWLTVYDRTSSEAMPN
jgi:beta-aspartyl-peptidase (threonine type)